MKEKIKAEDIKIGVAKVTSEGVFLYLKTDPRDVMNMLDKKFGELGWQAEHDTTVITTPDGSRTLPHCKLSVWDAEKNVWISRDGYGSEMPFAEVHRAKAEASDALKLAAIQFGIGRELYSFDNIFAFAKNEQNTVLINTFMEKDGEWRTNDEFICTQVIYDEAGEKIKALAIKDNTTGRMCFTEDRRDGKKDTNRAGVKLKDALEMAHDCSGHLAEKKLGDLSPDELLYVFGKTKSQTVKQGCIAIVNATPKAKEVFVAAGVNI